MINGRLTAGVSSLRKLAREIYRAAADTVLAQARALVDWSDTPILRAQFFPQPVPIEITLAEIVMSTTPRLPRASTSPMNYYPGKFSFFLAPRRREIAAATAFRM